MRKRILSLFVVLSTIILLCPVISVQAQAISADEMYRKFQELQARYPENSVWNDAYRVNNMEMSWQCMGWAETVCDYLFGENPRNWVQQYNLNNMAVGDHVRINNNGHSIVITNVVGDTIYYADCNANNDARVHWNKSMSRSQLQSKLTWIKSQPDNWVRTLSSTPVAPVSSAIHTDTNQHVRNGFFTFRNVSSNKVMQVYAGKDINTQPIDMWDFDGTIDQRFNVVHQGNGKYRIYAECSSGGTDKVVDIYRNGADIAEGQLVDLWTAKSEEDVAQLFYIWPVSSNEYVFEIAAKDGYVICPRDAAAANQNADNNGAPQLVVQKYTGAAYQKWKLCNNNGKETTSNISYASGAYKVDTDGDPLNVRNGPGTNNSSIGTVPDGAVLSITEVNGNWGKMSYNGLNGWVCLDFTVYTVVLDSISVVSKPTKTTYYVGDTFSADGLKITAKYSNGQTETLTSGFNVSCNVSSVGTKTATVTYNGKSTTFTVDVQDISVNDISLYSTDITKEYYVGDTVKQDEIKLLVNYNNGKGEMVSDGYDLIYDFSSPGTKTVTVSYGGKTTSYDVEVVASDEPSDTASLAVDSQNSYSGSAVTVPITLNASGVYDGNMTIQYDTDKLVIEDVQAVGALSDRQVFINKDYGADKIRVSFSGTTSIDTDEVILNLKFRVANNAQGTAVVSITEARAYNKSGESIVVNKADGAVQIIPTADDVTVTNIQSVSRDGKKVVTANVSDDSVMCYLAAFKNGALVACDAAQPSNGSVELSVSEGSNTQYKFMTWNMTMKPMMNAIGIY